MSPCPDLVSLLKAIDDRNAAAVAHLLSRAPELAGAEVAAEHGHAQTVLHRATPGDGDALTGARLEIVQRLLEAGAEVDAPGWGANHGICTPLTLAAWGGHVPVIRLLLDRGAGPNGMTSPGACPERPIDTAARHGHAAAVEVLIEAGASWSLEHLLMAGLEERLEAQLRADPAAACRLLDDGTPPLHLALTSPKGAGLLDLLLRHGADPSVRDLRGRTALHVAIEQEQAEAIQRLQQDRALIDLFAAAGLGDAVQVAELLSREPRGARESQADGVTPLFYAAWSGDALSTRLLLDAGAAVSPRAKRWWACLTPLHIALQKRHREVTTLLLERGADVGVAAADPGQYWPTPLHAAVRWGTRTDVELLLDHGADPNGGSAVPESMDTGALVLIASAGNVELARLLLDRGLDLRLARHREALHLAAERGPGTHAERGCEMVRLLLANGADPEGLTR